MIGTVEGGWMKLLRTAFTLWLVGGAFQNTIAQDRGQSVRPGVGATPSAQRVALVIGNSAYQEAPLANPVNDANDMAAQLESLGFTTLKANNADLQQMETLIREFGRRLPGSNVALFFFAGHGMQVDGENYLIPVGATITKQTEAKFMAVNAGLVLAQMGEDTQRANIIILDACRNNPFRGFRSTSGGLAAIDAPAGSLIAYATAPGKVASDGTGRNGLYTGELLKQMRVPGQNLNDALMQTGNAVRARSDGQQVPWQASSLGRHVYLNGLPAAGGAPQLSAEQALWNVVQYSNDPQDFRDFLQKYPQSNYADPARLRLKQLMDAAKPGSTSAPAGAGSWVVVADKRITVAANEAWTDTLIQVKRDQEIWIKVSGQANLGAFGSSGPDGISRGDAKRPAADCQTGALIARLGNEIVCIGAERRFTASADGRLALGLNESSPNDNSGGPIAKVVVQEKR
jgi:Caspase domain